MAARRRECEVRMGTREGAFSNIVNILRVFLFRQQAEKLAAENDELEAARLEMTSAAEEQSRGCVEMLGLLLDILWASSSASSWGDVSATQMSHFLKFGSKLILQILDMDNDTK